MTRRPLFTTASASAGAALAPMASEGHDRTLPGTVSGFAAGYRR